MAKLTIWHVSCNILAKETLFQRGVIMGFVIKGFPFLAGKAKRQKTEQRTDVKNPYVKASDDLKKSIEDLNKATRKLQQSFRHRQEAMNNLVSIFNKGEVKASPRRLAAEKKPKPRPQGQAAIKRNRETVGEAELFEVYREACINFIETDKIYYFKLRNHSDFLSAMYQRHMGNLRYYDHEFRRLSNSDQYRFTETEALVANQVIQAVSRIGREKFVREGHQNLYRQLCSEILPQKASQ